MVIHIKRADAKEINNLIRWNLIHDKMTLQNDLSKQCRNVRNFTIFQKCQVMFD